jgi:hypothetical protein|tara:strand:+ start:539 stop:745 length:207 start_codon:yes stop_codon:yes gene_type:complete
MAHEEYSWSQTSYKFLSDSQLVALDEYFEIQDIDDPLSYLEYQDCKTWGELYDLWCRRARSSGNETAG